MPRGNPQSTCMSVLILSTFLSFIFSILFTLDYRDSSKPKVVRNNAKEGLTVSWSVFSVSVVLLVCTHNMYKNKPNGVSVPV
tara:strand:+ start:1274 stop:1519 length:246 start_codon:yes stop_codon:yes gene_type:complete